MKKLKEVFESVLDLDEAKKLMVLDTLAASEADKIKDILKKDKLKFTQTGSILSVEIDPKSASAAVLRSHLHKKAKFDEITERDASMAAAIRAGQKIFEESVSEKDLVPGFTFFVLSANGQSLSRYKITGEKEMNVGTVLEVNHTVVAGDKFKQTFIAKDFVLGKKGSLQVFKNRKDANKAFKK
jgi:hypothetical protein